jgi:hypothetical protein
MQSLPQATGSAGSQLGYQKTITEFLESLSISNRDVDNRFLVSYAVHLSARVPTEDCELNFQALLLFHASLLERGLGFTSS